MTNDPFNRTDSPEEPDLPSLSTVTRWAERYLAQRSTSSLHLADVLRRRIRRLLLREQRPTREYEADIEVLVGRVVKRVVDAGLLDDGLYATSRVRTLKNKGLPSWRIERDLDGHGLADSENAAADLKEIDDEVQARRYAQRKRLGPYRVSEREGDRDKALRTLARAGFSRRAAEAALTPTD